MQQTNLAQKLEGPEADEYKQLYEKYILRGYEGLECPNYPSCVGAVDREPCTKGYISCKIYRDSIDDGK